MAASTTVVSLGTRKRGRKLTNGALTAMTFDLTFGETDNEENDIMEAGYVPAGVTVIGFIVTASVMDTGTVAVVHSVLLGSTALVAGLTNAQTGTSGLYPCTPTTTTAATVVSAKTTTAPDTAAAGTMQITPIYFSAP